jgi:tetratricopeptide (TPR) repeat protein
MPTDPKLALARSANTQTNGAGSQTRLAAVYLQKRRETNDPGYLERASKLIAGVLARNPEDYEARRLRSEIELERHHFRAVAEYSRELIHLAPEDAWNWATLGDALIEMGKYDEAGEAYQKMVDLKPGLTSYNRVAWYRFVHGDSDGAIEAMKKAIAAGASSPEHIAWCRVELGNFYFKSGRIAGAEQAFQTAILNQPGYHRALAGLGMVKAAQGELRSAIKYFREAQSVTPLPEYTAALHDLYEAVGDSLAARKQRDLLDTIDKLSQLDKTQGDRSIALIYADQERNLDRALDLVQLELAVRGDVYTYDALAWVLYKNRQYEQAEKAIEQALSLGTTEPLFYYHAGMIAYARGRKEDASKHLKHALGMNPKFHIRHAAKAERMLAEIL